ncbi:hypothetical protein HDU87_001118 [Geranomyces variabilis]|uniref:Uncharacterized protein n=1 Tax=Geranomyces variabilis TaxID=109894 RepID=A0AAD5TN29_9FUNG|nr:hypothetical protein HDU87_001118 [Geranomyces variabilis]
MGSLNTMSIMHIKRERGDDTDILLTKRARYEDSRGISPSGPTKRARENVGSLPQPGGQHAEANWRQARPDAAGMACDAPDETCSSPLDALCPNQNISDSDWHAAVAHITTDACANYKQSAAIRPPRETSRGFFVKNLAGGAGPPVQVKLKNGNKIIPRVTLTFFARVLLPSKVICAATTVRDVKMNEKALPRFVYKAAEKLRVGGVRYVAFDAKFASSERHSFDVGEASRLECVVCLMSYHHDNLVT